MSAQDPAGSLDNIGLQGGGGAVGGDDDVEPTLTDRIQQGDQGDGSQTPAEDAATLQAKYDALQQQHQNLEALHGQQSAELGDLRQRAQAQGPGWGPGQAGPSQQYAGWGQQGPQQQPGAPQVPAELTQAYQQAQITGDPSAFLGALFQHADRAMTQRAVQIAVAAQTMQARGQTFERDFFTQNPGLEAGPPRTVFDMALAKARSESGPGTENAALYGAAKAQAEAALTQLEWENVAGADAAAAEARKLQGAQPRGARPPAGATTQQTPDQVMADMNKTVGDMARQRQAETRRTQGGRSTTK